MGAYMDGDFMVILSMFLLGDYLGLDTGTYI